MSEIARPTTTATVVRRAARTLGLSVFVFASLLTFPHALPWMVAAWLAWHVALLLRDKPCWMPLAACGAVLLAKNPALLPGLGILLAAALVECVLLGIARFHAVRTRSRAIAAIACILLAASWTCFALDWWGVGRVAARPSNGRPIVLLGDSLTADMHPHGSYADRLRHLIAPPIVNLGRPGITATIGLETLPKALDVRPQIVVVELGGHDFLHGRSREETQAALEQIIVDCQAAGAAVVLVEVPRGLIRDPYRGLERELAHRHGLALVPDTPLRRLVLQSRYSPLDAIFPSQRMSEDGIHPNRHGNRMLADYIADTIAACVTHVRRGAPDNL